MSVLSETVGLYTPLSTALQELDRRRNDPVLRKRIQDYFATSPCPRGLGAEPKIVMAPPLVSPNFELKYFLDICTSVPIQSMFLEFTQDKFVHLNFEKRHLGNMIFYKKTPHARAEVSGAIRIVDFEKEQGKPFTAIETIQGENFVDFHHRLVSQYLPDTPIERYDFSEWFIASRSFSPEFRYLRYLGLFLCDGILCSNFVTEKYHSPFTRAYVIPAFKKLEELFGVQPLIVPIEPLETDADPFWCYYPEEIRQWL